MRTPLFTLLASIAIAAAAQDQAKPQEPDKDEQARIRAERSAGGLGKITPEEKANANVGAGPHKERLGGAARREPREEDRGGTSDKSLESGDAQRDARRP
jgi:hypothetical protein